MSESATLLLDSSSVLRLGDLAFKWESLLAVVVVAAVGWVRVVVLAEALWEVVVVGWGVEAFVLLALLASSSSSSSSHAMSSSLSAAASAVGICQLESVLAGCCVIRNSIPLRTSFRFFSSSSIALRMK